MPLHLAEEVSSLFMVPVGWAKHFFGTLYHLHYSQRGDIVLIGIKFIKFQ